jgi:8-oxo-dGTP pyrophosphatase MutT (NUDIX family)
MYLGTPDTTGELGIVPGPTTYHAPYMGKRKQIKQYLDLLDKSKAPTSIVLYSDQVEQLWEDFQSCFKILEAAGGYVTNPSGELLVFERRGSWDMPKGKIDAGETPEAAALREVEEETGLQHLTLGPLLCHTWHTYDQKGERILKKTYWYAMQTTDTTTTPQTEEDIEQIMWVQPAAWLAQKPVVYASIVDVIKAGMAQQ